MSTAPPTAVGPPVPEVPALTLGGVLEHVAELHGPNEAIVFDDPLRDGETVRWSYATLRCESRRIGRALLDLGVEPGEPVGVLMGDRPDAVAALVGAALVGALAVPMSTFAPRPELADMLRRSGATVVLTQERLLARRFTDDIEALRPDLPALRHVAAVGTGGWAELRARADEVPEAALEARAPAPDDPALVIFTSGTTSAPKAVVHAHRSPALQAWTQAGIFGRHPGTRMFCALPLFWTAGLNTALGATLAAGGCWVAQETFDPTTALALMSRERVTEPYTLPHQAAALTEQPEWATIDLSALRCVFGKSVYARHPTVAGDPGWQMPVGYGLSETCAFFSSYPSTASREEVQVGMGPLLPGNELRVVDPESGRVLPFGTEGELAVKGPTLMLRYLDADARVDDDGFLHTGDVGHVRDGVLHFTGRLTEMIKTGGANVSPAEIEVQLRACAPVKLSRVVGIPDDRLDEVVVACITLKDGAAATAEEVRAFLRARVAPYKVPSHVLFFADGEIPMTRSDTKVRDDALVALVRSRLDSNGGP